MKPRLYILIGISGAGKTTYSKEVLIPQLKKENRKYVYLASDDIRELIYGDANCQDNPGKVFEIMKYKKNKALQEGKDVIYDATNLKRKDRKSSLTTEVDCDKIAVLFNVSTDTSKARQKLRSRQVQDYVIERQYNQLVMPTKEEGFTEIILVN